MFPDLWSVESTPSIAPTQLDVKKNNINNIIKTILEEMLVTLLVVGVIGVVFLYITCFSHERMEKIRLSSTLSTHSSAGLLGASTSSFASASDQDYSSHTVRKMSPLERAIKGIPESPPLNSERTKGPLDDALDTVDGFFNKFLKTK